MPSFTTHQIQKIYSIFLNNTINWLRKKGYPIEHRSLKIEPIPNDCVQIQPSDVFHFRNWPLKHGGYKKIHILASTYEVISLRSGTCLKSSVQTNYFKIKGNEAKALEYFHFDYDKSVQKQHPICHLQTCNKKIEIMPESFNEFTIRDKNQESRCQSIHFPSAFINLIGLFTILAADHLKEEHWFEFMNEIKKHYKKMPSLIHPNFKLVSAWDWYELK